MDSSQIQLSTKTQRYILARQKIHDYVYCAILTNSDFNAMCQGKGYFDSVDGLVKNNPNVKV